MDDEAHVAIDLAVEGDEQLLREALEALKGALPIAARTSLTREYDTIARARAAITNLEQRLLEE